VLERIMAKLGGEAGGVPFDKFPRLRAMAAIEKSTVMARQKKVDEEMRQETLKAKKAEVDESLADARASLATAKSELAAAEAARKKLPGKEPTSKPLPAAKLQEILDEADAATARATAAREALAENLKALTAEGAADDEDAELQSFRKQRTAELEDEAAKLKGQGQKLAAAVKTGRTRVQRRIFNELEVQRGALAVAMQEFLGATGKTVEGLFKEAAKGSSLDKAAFLALLEKVHEGRGEKMDDGMNADGGRLFKHLTAGGETLSKERFVQSMELVYRVVKPTMITEAEELSSKAVRRLEVGESLMADGIPTKEKVLRIKCKAPSDGVEGWVTIEGNQGTIFLETRSHYWICTKETLITEELAVSSATSGNLLKDSIVEIMEFNQKDPTSSVMRAKTRVVQEGTTGWVTMESSAGTVFLEPC